MAEKCKRIIPRKNKPRRLFSLRGFMMVPVVGVEPTRYHYHRILSPARLPIPSYRLAYSLIIILLTYFIVNCFLPAIPLWLQSIYSCPAPHRQNADSPFSLCLHTQNHTFPALALTDCYPQNGRQTPHLHPYF